MRLSALSVLVARVLPFACPFACLPSVNPLERLNVRQVCARVMRVTCARVPTGDVRVREVGLLPSRMLPIFTFGITLGFYLVIITLGL